MPDSLASCMLNDEVRGFPRWAEKVDEFQQQIELYKMDYVEENVWASLEADIKSARAQVCFARFLPPSLSVELSVCLFLSLTLSRAHALALSL